MCRVVDAFVEQLNMDKLCFASGRSLLIPGDQAYDSAPLCSSCYLYGYLNSESALHAVWKLSAAEM